MNCDGCTLERDDGTLIAFRPDGFGETFYLCPLCRESVALSEAATVGSATQRAIEALRVQRDACTESRRAIIETIIREMDACAAAFQACSNAAEVSGQRVCGCGSAAKSAHSVAMRFREQRPNDGRGARCGVRISGDAWCVLDIGHEGAHD